MTEAYIVSRVSAPVLAPIAPDRAFSPEALGAPWQALYEARIALYPWAQANAYTPDARARVCVDDTGLHVLMYACEEQIQAKETRVGGRQCADSCLEFFFTPFPETDARYLNFELNPLAVPHIGIGAGRHDRTVLTSVPDGMNPVHSLHKGAWWAVYYAVPNVFIQSVFGKTPVSGQVMRGNFYTCDESVHPHFGTWHPVDSVRPDFHRPEDFGKLILQ